MKNQTTLILKINGIFLIVMGVFAAISDLLGYFKGVGPFGEVCFNNSLTIGQFEAHGLAIIFGVLLFSKKAKENFVFYHKAAIAVHILLFCSNLIWFEIFHQTNSLILGYIATTAHFVFIFLNALGVFLSWKK